MIDGKNPLQWGRPSRRAEILVAFCSGCAERCFNGAALREGRKSMRPRYLDDLVGFASMGPPFEKGGNKPTCQRMRSKMARLQWGRPSRRAEIENFGARTRKEFAASMGPPFEKGGNQGGRADRFDLLAASMGPPFEKGGNALDATTDDRWTIRLQWGRPSRRAEMGKTGADPDARNCCFNGAALREGRK